MKSTTLVIKHFSNLNFLFLIHIFDKKNLKRALAIISEQPFFWTSLSVFYPMKYDLARVLLRLEATHQIPLYLLGEK